MTVHAAQMSDVTIKSVVTDDPMVTRELLAAQALSPCHHLSPPKLVRIRARAVGFRCASDAGDTGDTGDKEGRRGGSVPAKLRPLDRMGSKLRKKPKLDFGI
jgi:hypothetical protein